LSSPLWRRLSCIVLFIVAHGTVLPLPAQAAADKSDPTAPQTIALDFDVPGGHFFTEANGAPLGKSSTGFQLGDDGGIAMWTGYQRLGGVGLLGYPVSGRFLANGMVEQATQRAILQWQANSGSVVLANVFDQLHDLGKDAWLRQVYQIPPQASFDEHNLTFAQVQEKRLALLAGVPAIKARFDSATDPIQLYGLPTSGPVDFGPMVALRCQRVVFQYWKVATPWAKPGDVTLVNGGDVAKAAGTVPTAAATPSPSPVVDGQAATLPWSGWWWPASLSPYTPPYLFGADGPLAKYDQYVAARGQPLPGVQQWERQHLVWNDPTFDWAGHCNGWAASALLEPEPTAPTTASGITFGVGDQKGLLADYHFSDTPLWEYGSLKSSLLPADLHRMVLTWLGQRHLGFVIDDYAASDQIESFPVYRFHLVYLPDPLDANKTHVQVTLWMADYHVPADFTGLRPYPSADGQRFDYFITGPKDNPTGGEWEGVSLVGKRGHPRFIWYPDPAVRNVGTTLTDPALTYSTILDILGRAQPKSPSNGPLRWQRPSPIGSRDLPWLGNEER